MHDHPHIEHIYFFGRFNFPHVGYLYVLRETLTQFNPKGGVSLVFSAEQTTWNKKAISRSHREAMFALALKELPEELATYVTFSDAEIQVQKKLGVSYGGYTVDTLDYLGRTHALDHTAIVMGADAALGIPGHHEGITAWKSWERISEMVRLIIIPRGRYSTAQEVRDHLPPQLLSLYEENRVIILSTNPTELELHASSSAIQEGATQFLPSSVYRYATSHSLL